MPTLAPYALLLALLLSALGPARAAEPGAPVLAATAAQPAADEAALASSVAKMRLPSLERRLARLRSVGATRETAVEAPASLAVMGGGVAGER